MNAKTKCFHERGRLGIDHTAIVVSDTDQSLEFYRDALGMKIAGGAENYGVEQEQLNQVFGARLRITAPTARRNRSASVPAGALACVRVKLGVCIEH